MDHQWLGRSLSLAVALGVSLAAATEFLLPPSSIAQAVQSSRSAEADRLRQQGKQQYANNQLEAASQSWQQALKIYRELNDRYNESRALNNLGIVEDDSGNYTKAISYYQQSLAVAKELKDQEFIGKLLNNLGIVYKGLDDYPKVIEYYQQSLNLAQKVNDRQGEGEVLGNLGNLYLALNDYAKAIEYQTRSLAIAQQLNDRRGERQILGSLGNAYQYLDDYPKAIAYYQQSLTIARAIKDQAGIGKVIGNLGVAYESMGNYTQAITYYQQSLAIAREFKNRRSEGLSLGNLGNAYLLLGDHAKAIELQTQSLAIAREFHDRDGESAALESLGLAHAGLGNYPKAIEFSQQSLAIARALKNRRSEGTSLANLGNVYQLLGNYAQAIAYQQQSLAIARALKDRLGEAKILGNLGVLNDILGNYSEAIAHFEIALKIAREFNDRSSAAKSLNNLGSVYKAINNPAKAIAYYQQSLTIAQQIKDRQGEGASLGNLGAVYRARGDYAKAIDYQQQRLKITQELNDRQGESEALTNLGVAYRSLGNYAKAMELHQQSLVIARTINNRLSAGIAQHNLGVTLIATKQWPQAESALRAAIVVWESLRVGLTDRDKVSLSETQAITYRLLQQVLVRQNRSDAALEIAEQGRARAFTELLSARLPGKSIAEIQKIAQAPSLATIRRIAKTQNATLVEYSLVDDDAIYIWIVKPSGEIAFHTSKLSAAASINQLVANSRSAIGGRGRGKPAQPASSLSDLVRLHKILIAPIAADLPTDPNQRVIFLPQGSLFLVPFAALQDAQGKFLIEQHTISTAPSIQTLELTHAKTFTAKGNALVVGDPTMPRWQDEQLPALPGARQEAIAIAQILNTQPLIGAQATKTKVLKGMQQAAIVHLATHGLLNTVKGDIPGAIALAPNSPDNGLLTASEIFDLKLNANLVVLSACDTGRGDITGDGVIGLSRSLIAAGVPSVIVSLWAVNDSSTSVLMSEFYRQLKTKPDKAQALRQAMLTTLKQYPNPSDWAAFTLIGES